METGGGATQRLKKSGVLTPRLEIGARELLDRQDRVRETLRREGRAAMVFFGSTSIFYLTGFAFIPTERPLVFILPAEGESALFVPRLEKEHARVMGAAVDMVADYPEYPGETHPMRLLAGLLGDLGLAGRPLAADAPGYGSAWGYVGPKLQEVLGGDEPALIPKLVEDLRVRKSEAEVGLIRESGRWGNLAHALLQDYSVPGANETDISARASMEATAAMIKTLGPGYDPRGGGGAGAGFRGQIGPHSANPHAVTRNARLRTGDVLVTGAGATVWGYNSELERTMFVGPPSAEQKRFFEHMLALQDIAFEAIRPGRPCSDVDRAVRTYFDKHQLWPYWRHHVGHALGILGHEAPFFDSGDDTVIEPGMVFSVEPGLYVEGLGGFRHSDTLVVTGDGVEFLTYYPRDLDSLICG
jgi:Xaa-Pro aminopeptidase